MKEGDLMEGKVVEEKPLLTIEDTCKRLLLHVACIQQRPYGM